MRKLALLLGSLVVVASASAKEVVPAPVVVEEAPVQIVEKEVIVYRDKEEGFRPNGYVDLQYRYYGDTEGQNQDFGTVKDKKDPTAWNKANNFSRLQLMRPNGYVDLQYRYYGDTEGQNQDFGTVKDKKDPTAWNKANNFSRLQLMGKINMTEKQALEFRIRDWNDLDQENVRQKSETQTRLRYFYDHGNLGDSKVNYTSRIHYLHQEGSQELEYSARFNFAEYMFNNDFVKTTNFELVPFYKYAWDADNSSNYTNTVGARLKSNYDLPWGFFNNDFVKTTNFELVPFYKYAWDADNSSNYTNTVGARLKSNYDLPWGFTAEFNLYADQNFYGNGAEKTVKDGDKAGKEDKEFVATMEAYLYHTLPLYSNDKVSVTFNNEVGYDPYVLWTQHKAYDETTKKESDDANYTLYYTSTIGVDYQATPNVTLYAHVGATYQNWTRLDENSASNWRWQPTAWAGFKTTF